MKCGSVPPTPSVPMAGGRLLFEYQTQLFPASAHARGTTAIGGSLTCPVTLNGFPCKDSPYNSDLTYDLRQIAVFGEATYTLFDRLGVTAGLRWYDWEEDKTFKSGGIFSNGDCAKPERDGVLQRPHAPVHG